MRCATNEVNANPIDLHINDNLLPDLDVTVYFSIQPWTPYLFLCLSSIILCGSFSSFPLQNIQELLLGLNDSQVCVCVCFCVSMWCCMREWMFFICHFHFPSAYCIESSEMNQNLYTLRDKSARLYAWMSLATCVCCRQKTIAQINFIAERHPISISRTF